MEGGKCDFEVRRRSKPYDALSKVRKKEILLNLLSNIGIHLWQGF